MTASNTLPQKARSVGLFAQPVFTQKLAQVFAVEVGATRRRGKVSFVAFEKSLQIDPLEFSTTRALASFEGHVESNGSERRRWR